MTNSPSTQQQTRTDDRGPDVFPAPPATSAADARGGFVRPLLWLLLVISAAGNVVISSMDLNVLVELPVGLLSLASAIALVVHHYRNRRR